MGNILKIVLVAKIQRLPILVSAEGNSRLLAVPNLCSGKGIDIANTVITCLQDRHLANNVKAMYFGITESSAGTKKGLFEATSASTSLPTLCEWNYNFRCI